MEKLLIPLSGNKPPEERSFRKREPLSEEGQRVLDDREIRRVFDSVSRNHGDSLYYRFQLAKENLKRIFGASIEMVETPCSGLRIVAKFEFLTTHKSVDEDLDEMVRSLGFSLSLKSYPVLEGTFEERNEKIERTLPVVMWYDKNPKAKEGDRFQPPMLPVYGLKTVVSYEPRMERIYVIKERDYQSADFSKAAQSAENLLKLVSTLRPTIHEDLPDDNPAEIVSITAARSTKVPRPQEPEIDPPLVGAKAS